MTAKDGWLKALRAQKLDVRSARDALQVVGWLDTGNYALNWAISGRLQGGYPLGHTVEVSGDPSTGKSFLAARALAMAQAAGGVALLDDVEGAYNVDHAARIGVDVDALAVQNSRTVDDHLATFNAFSEAYGKLRPKGPGVVVCDSLAALTTKHELEQELDRPDLTKAKELRTFYRLMGGKLFGQPLLHLATNHTIANIGNYFQPRTTPGGGGPKFAASVRLDLRPVSKVKRDEDVLGVICRVVVEKNRVAAPWRRVSLAIPFGTQPIGRASGLMHLLLGMGVVRHEGQYLTYEGSRVGRVALKDKNRFLDVDVLGEQLIVEHPEVLLQTAGLDQPGGAAVTEEEVT